MENETQSFESLIEKNLTGSDLEEFNKLYYGRKDHNEVKMKTSSLEAAKEADFELAAYAFPAQKEHTRPPRIVKIGLIQNSIAIPTDRPVGEQRSALHQKLKKIIDVAGNEGVNILCLQELWPMPYAFCTREKLPWCEFAESAENGPTTMFLRELAIKYAMVILSPILERDEKHSDTIWNTIVVINDTGNVIGKHRKNHIPRVGDYNESSYYFEGNTGHQVFSTRYAKFGFNICFGRHHVMNWLMYGLNGAEIVFNPSAIYSDNAEYMWPIEARNAAITNCYFTASINRVGYEEFPNEFTSGDGKPASNRTKFFFGSSYITGPDGVRSPGLSRTKDGLLIGVLDLNLNRQIRDRRCYYMTQRLDMYVQSLSKVLELDYEPPVVSEKDKKNE